jgi:dynein heavy chain
MVEEICNLLNNGEIPNLFPQDERAKIIEEVIGAPQSASPNEKYQHFVQKCRLNLHIIICMQPVGESFRRRLRNFPALVNCTTIDWFQSWPEEALASTASSFFLQNYENETDSDLRDGLVRVAVEAHDKVCEITKVYYQELRRFFYVTPT